MHPPNYIISQQASLIAPEHQHSITCSAEGSEQQLVVARSELPRAQMAAAEGQRLALTRAQLAALLARTPTLDNPRGVFPPLKIRNCELRTFEHNGRALVLLFVAEHAPFSPHARQLTARFPYLEDAVRQQKAADPLCAALGSTQFIEVASNVTVALAAVYTRPDIHLELDLVALETCLDTAGRYAASNHMSAHVERLSGGKFSSSPQERFELLQSGLRRFFNACFVPTVVYMPRYTECPV